MEPHTHPEYEETFQRIMNTLDVIVSTQLKQSTLQGRILETQADQARVQAEQARAQAELTRSLDRLTERVDHLTAAVDKLDIKQAETTDKLNALIDLMDRHQKEHRERGI